MKIIVGILTVIATTLLVCVIIALPTMYLWNWIMPLIFGLIKISFWEALGLNLLCACLFKSSYSNK